MEKLTRAQLFKQKHSHVDYVDFKTSDGADWTMIKPSSRFYFDLLMKHDVTIGGLSVELQSEELKKDPEKLRESAKKLTAVYDVMKDALLKYSHSPKLVDSGIVAESEDQLSLDDLPSFEYMSELFNLLIQSSGVPLDEVKDHESFRGEARGDAGSPV